MYAITMVTIPQDVHATVSAHFKDIPRVNGESNIHRDLTFDLATPLRATAQTSGETAELFIGP